jgi:hypothetical protein
VKASLSKENKIYVEFWFFIGIVFGFADFEGLIFGYKIYK